MEPIQELETRTLPDVLKFNDGSKVISKQDWKKRKEEIEKNTPLGRLGNTSDIANVVEFLISDKANFITGQEIIVDGGYSLNKE